MEKTKEATFEKAKRNKSLLYFAGSLFVALGLTWLLRELGFSDSQGYALFLLFFAVGLWVTEAIPPFAVGLFIMAYLVYTFGNPHLNSNPEKIDKYVNTFSSSIIWLLLGGFFLAAAMTKTRLDEKLLRFTLKISGSDPGRILVAITFTSMAASCLMSNTAVTAMMLAAISPLLQAIGKTGLSKALLLSIALASTTGGMATVIGSPSNVISAGILENAGIHIGFLEWMLIGVPVSVLLTGLSCWVLLKIHVKSTEPISLAFLDNRNELEESAEMRTERRIVVAVLGITVLLWLTGSWHGIPVAAVSAIPIVALTLTGVITGGNIKTLSWDTLFMVAGGLSLGAALQSTGLMTHYASLMQDVGVSPVMLVLILAYVAVMCANLMSHTATTTILVPLGMALVPELKEQAAICIGLASTMALFLPISTPPNAIVYGTGYLDQKDFRLGGLLVGLLGPLLAVLLVFLLKG